MARQAPLSMGFSRQEYWSGIGSMFTAPAGGFFTTELPGRLQQWVYARVTVTLNTHTHTHTHPSVFSICFHSLAFHTIYAFGCLNRYLLGINEFSCEETKLLEFLSMVGEG